MSVLHMLPIRVYYADTDAIGVVYHANYLRYLEQARTEFLRELGFELPSLLAAHGVMFVVIQANIKYLQPARLNDQLLVVSKISHVGKASLTYQQNVHLTDQHGDLLCSAEVKLVTVNQNMRPVPIPGALKTEIV
jgi:acyl-CoA thioester hydrolase